MVPASNTVPPSGGPEPSRPPVPSRVARGSCDADLPVTKGVPPPCTTRTARCVSRRSPPSVNATPLGVSAASRDAEPRSADRRGRGRRKSAAPAAGNSCASAIRTSSPGSRPTASEAGARWPAPRAEARRGAARSSESPRARRPCCDLASKRQIVLGSLLPLDRRLPGCARLDRRRCSRRPKRVPARSRADLRADPDLLACTRAAASPSPLRRGFLRVSPPCFDRSPLPARRRGRPVERLRASCANGADDSRSSRVAASAGRVLSANDAAARAPDRRARRRHRRRAAWCSRSAIRSRSTSWASSC
jgi:hypothetical protein